MRERRPVYLSIVPEGPSSLQVCPRVAIRIFAGVGAKVKAVNAAELRLRLFLLGCFHREVRVAGFSPFNRLGPYFLLAIGVGEARDIYQRFKAVKFVVSFALFYVQVMRCRSFVNDYCRRPHAFCFVCDGRFVLCQRFPGAGSFVLREVTPCPSSI